MYNARMHDTSLFLFFVEDFIDAYHAMNSSLDEHQSDEVITATFVSVKLFPRIATIATKSKNGNKNVIEIHLDQSTKQ